MGGLGAWDKLCSITGRSFSLRQLNCGNSGGAVALVEALHPDVTGRYCRYSPEKVILDDCSLDKVHIFFRMLRFENFRKNVNWSDN